MSTRKRCRSSWRDGSADLHKLSKVFCFQNNIWLHVFVCMALNWLHKAVIDSDSLAVAFWRQYLIGNYIVLAVAHSKYNSCLHSASCQACLIAICRNRMKQFGKRFREKNERKGERQQQRSDSISWAHNKKRLRKAFVKDTNRWFSRLCWQPGISWPSLVPVRHIAFIDFTNSSAECRNDIVFFS